MKFISARFARFLLVGLANTLVGYVLYLGANHFMDYRWAYTISYVLGIGISYLLNSWFVFREPLSMASLLKFPAVYVVQYAVGLAVVWLFVSRMELHEALAPLVVVPITVPLTYVLSRFVFSPQKAHESQ